ncbi:MAG: MEDS domain-containing protein [Deltaproteobacteria bacterium]|nr:MEDS domain-containing protein [Deltaproteobacteria bacterium]
MEGDSRDSGIKAVGQIKWGAHLCQFYKDKAALLELLCAYFIAGLESNEFCMWVTPAHTTVEEAKGLMRKHLSGFDEYLEKGQMMVISHLDWYKKGGSFELKRVLDGWLEIYSREIEGRGYAGMRVSGDTSWLCEDEWKGFDEYERVLQGSVAGYRLLVLCTYSLDHIGAKELLDVVASHDFVLIERGGGWEFAESPGKRRLMEGLEAAKEELESKYRERTSELFEANLRLTNEIGERARTEESLRESLTERKTMEEALRKSEASLIAAQRLARIVSWEWDLRTDKEAFSDEVYTLLGISKEGAGIIDCLKRFIYPGDLDAVSAAVRSAVEGLGPFIAEYRIIRQDGRIREVRSEGELSIDPKTGAPAGITGFTQDVTEWKRLQEENERIRERHLNAQRTELIGKLAGGIAHEFNNIMSSIKLNSELALSEPDERAKREFLEDIRSASGQAENLTRQLLIFSSNEPAHFALHDINGAVREAVSMLRSLLPENIEIRTDLEDGTWPVFADRLHIEQILLNLALNARDAMPDGGRLSIKTRNTVVTSDNRDGLVAGRYLSLLVSDTGTGMNAEVMKRAFEPFFTTKGGKGMGLGLAVVKRIVGEHKGEIRASSEPFKGASFEVFLPAMNRPAAQAKETAGLGNGERILIVEDEERLRKVVALVLRKSGYKVFESRSAAEALGVFRREGGKVDLVFTDVILEDKSGIELADELSRRGGAPKVLFTSGYMDIKDGWPEAEGRKLKLLTKPYEVTELLAAVKEILRA